MSTETATDRETRLPKWAQEELATLRRRVEVAERLAEDARLATDPAGSTALLTRGIDDPIGLGAHANIDFVIDERHVIHVRVVDGELDLNSSGGAIAVLPRATNAARIGVLTH